MLKLLFLTYSINGLKYSQFESQADNSEALLNANLRSCAVSLRRLFVIWLACTCMVYLKGQRRGSLVVERRTPEREVGGSILTQVAVLYP